MCCVLLHLGIITSDDGHSDSDLLDLAKINLPFIRRNPSDDDNGLSAGQESRKIQITMHFRPTQTSNAVDSSDILQ
jgi:hypothetical protein